MIMKNRYKDRKGQKLVVTQEGEKGSKFKRMKKY
jgi:hypothetical protein